MHKGAPPRSRPPGSGTANTLPLFTRDYACAQTLLDGMDVRSAKGKAWGSDKVNVEGWKPLKRPVGHESGASVHLVGYKRTQHTYGLLL